MEDYVQVAKMAALSESQRLFLNQNMQYLGPQMCFS